MSRKQLCAWCACTCVALCASPAYAGDDDLALDLGGSVTLDLRRIPKGAFVQGSPAGETGHEADETTRNVTISKSFWLGKTPVTKGQFARFVSDTRHVTEAEKAQAPSSWRNPGFLQKDDDPVVVMTYADASAFVAWASRKSGRRVRLPSEAEWEYAARAGTTTPWAGAGKEEDTSGIGWFKSNSSATTHPVGGKKANAFGVFDMSGNVYEWCRDIYGPYPAGDATDPEVGSNTTTDAEKRVVRGGSWNKDPKRGRSASRHKIYLNTRSPEVGFRVSADDDGQHAAAPPPPPEAPAAASAMPVGGEDAGVAAEAAVPTPAPRNEGLPWMLFAAPVAGAGFAVGWVLARRRRYPAGTFGITTRAQGNGFWIRVEGIVAGTRVEYTCVVEGKDHVAIVTLEGENTFVRTGGHPKGIRILEVLAPKPGEVPPTPGAPVVRPFHPPSGPMLPAAMRPSVRIAAEPISMTGPNLPAAHPASVPLLKASTPPFSAPPPVSGPPPPPLPPPAHDSIPGPRDSGPVSAAEAARASAPRHAIVDKRESQAPFPISSAPMISPEDFIEVERPLELPKPPPVPVVPVVPPAPKSGPALPPKAPATPKFLEEAAKKEDSSPKDLGSGLKPKLPLPPSPTSEPKKDDSKPKDELPKAPTSEPKKEEPPKF